MSENTTIQPQKAEKTTIDKYGSKCEVIRVPCVRIFLSGHDSGKLHILGTCDDIINAINKGKVFLAYKQDCWDFRTHELMKNAAPIYINPSGIRYFYDDPIGIEVSPGGFHSTF